MKINDYAKQLRLYKCNPQKIQDLANALEEEHGDAKRKEIRQCRVTLGWVDPHPMIRANLEPVSLSFVLGCILADRSIGQQALQGYVMDLQASHSMLMKLDPDYPRILNGFMDHHLQIDES